MQGKKLVRDIFLEKIILEDITSFIVHDLDIGFVSSSRERAQEFLTPFLMHTPDIDGRVSVKIILISYS